VVDGTKREVMRSRTPALSFRQHEIIAASACHHLLPITTEDGFLSHRASIVVACITSRSVGLEAGSRLTFIPNLPFCAAFGYEYFGTFAEFSFHNVAYHVHVRFLVLLTFVCIAYLPHHGSI